MEIKLEDPYQNRILLEETFHVLSKKSSTLKVRLTPEGLHLIRDTEQNCKEQIISTADIIGCQCFRSKKRTRDCTCQSLPRSDSLQVVEENSTDLDDADISAYLYIYAYIFQGMKENSKKRERTTITLRFRSFDKYDDNYKEAQRWRNAVKRLIKGEHITTNVLNDWSLTNRHKETRRLLILCNPKSGAGKGKQIFQQKVAPILSEAEIPYDLYMTKHYNFARDFVRSNNLFQWTGIVAVGGDGIVFEVINGIFERPDWSIVIKSIPIGVVPGGSGNGLARSIAHHAAEPYLPTPTLPSTLAAIRGQSEPMDLVRVETMSQILFSFLSVGWGLLSDIDIESERLRVLGGTRFTIWSVARLIGLRSYKGKLWYLPSDIPISYSNEKFGSPLNVGCNLDLPAEMHLESQEGKRFDMSVKMYLKSLYKVLAAQNPVFYGSATNNYIEILRKQHRFYLSFANAPFANKDRKKSDSVGNIIRREKHFAMTNLSKYITSNTSTSTEGRPRVDSWYSAHSRRSTYFSTGGSSYQSTTDSGLGEGDTYNSKDKTRRIYGPAPQLPSLTAALPDTWKCIDGRFVMVHASYQSHLGEDCLFAPEARLNDGRIWLLIVKHGASRTQLLYFLLGLSTGAHADASNKDATGNIELIPVNAFRIEPDMTEKGYMTIDGEHVDYGAIQAEIFPELGRVMVP